MYHGSDNVIDLTETLTGDTKYKPRPIKIVLYTIKHKKNWKEYISKIANCIHGKRLKIIFDDDPGFYYEGRCILNKLETDKNVGKITIDVTADAYKYCINSSDGNWLWDPFNFETDRIQELSNIKVDGELELELYNLKMKVIPIITVSNKMNVQFNNENYLLDEGENEILDIELLEGKNILKFVGQGIISIEYRGGSL